ncbi:hypothetical protein OH77DRAFT_730737 [Trametes cingulata]|nr:hypothetical protein OH77DRAFT_730737 [Trametes cingulata]
MPTLAQHQCAKSSPERRQQPPGSSRMRPERRRRDISLKRLHTCDVLFDCLAVHSAQAMRLFRFAPPNGAGRSIGKWQNLCLAEALRFIRSLR